MQLSGMKWVVGILIIFQSLPSLSQKPVTGTVADSSTSDPLPFITVSLKNSLVATVTNEKGQFELIIPDSLNHDTLMVVCIGYNPVALPVKSLTSPLNILLQLASFNLNEVIIRPMPPEYYIKLAMQSLKQNYPSAPFQSEAYYREKVMENDNILNFTEAVFRTYNSNYCDTAVKSDFQLLLYNKADKKQVAFMNKENKKKKRKIKVENKDGVEGSVTDTTSKINIGDLFGGPETIMSLDIIRGEEDFLDSSNFRDFEYAFAPASSYNNKELMVIDFHSKGRSDKMRKMGKIYIDIESNAIVSIDYSGDLRLPLMATPILLVMGLQMDKPVFHKRIDYVKINGKWYPSSLQGAADILVWKKHFFKQNEYARFYIDGILATNKFTTSGPKPIDTTKRFNKKKKMEEQVFNDDKVTWDQINVIKR